METNLPALAVAVSCIPLRQSFHGKAYFFALATGVLCIGNIRSAFYKYCLFVVFILLATGIYAQNCTVNAGVNQQVCGSAATLSGNGNGNTNGNPVWSFVSGPVTPVIASPNSASSNVTGMTQGGLYTFRLSQLCQDGVTASQTVTVTAYPTPNFTAGTDFSYCGYTDVKTMAATLPAGWTGIWRVEDATSAGSVQTSAFTFSDITSPTATVSAPSCPRLSYRFIWEITSPNGQCKYSANIVGVWNPNPINIDWDNSNPTVCMGGNANYALSAGKCGFWAGYNSGYNLTVNTLTAPAGFTGTLTAVTNVFGNLDINNFGVAGNYTFTVSLTSPCGNQTYGPFSATVLPARPTVTNNNSTTAFCIKNVPQSVSFGLTMSSADVVFSISSVSVPSGADPLSTSISASGTTRTILATPNTKWKPGSYLINWSARSSSDVNSNCTTTGSSVIQVYDSISIPMNMPDLNACIPVGTTTTSVTVTLPAYPSYLTADYGPRYAITKLSGPAGGASVTSNYYATTAALTGLQAGTYSYRIIPNGTYIVDEYACSSGPYADTFTVKVYYAAVSNAGTNQTIHCLQNFALAGNIIPSPSYGTWSQVSGPSTITFDNTHKASAIATGQAGSKIGDYDLRWTISDSNNVCSTAFSDVVITTDSSCPAVLPVTLLSFKGAKQASQTALDWITTNEIDLQEFVLEWSTNATQWMQIGTVAATGSNNSINKYGYLHQNPVNGDNFYRLKQVDKDGKSSYSSTVNVNFSGLTNHLFVFPNPIKDKISVANAAVGSVINIYSIDGRLLLKKVAKNQVELIDMGSYAKGIYVLSVTDENGHNVCRFPIVK